MKKETLEEAAQKYAISMDLNKTSHLMGFMSGAKWKQDRGYSEEDILKAQQVILCNIKDAHMDTNYILEYLQQLKK